jgi:hypothetical protein
MHSNGNAVIPLEGTLPFRSSRPKQNSSIPSEGSSNVPPKKGNSSLALEE